MIHLNPLLQTKGLAARLYEFASPQIYSASSITDFLQNKDSITPTNTIRALRYGFLGLNPGCLNLVDSAFILLSDQTYKGPPHEGLEDPTGYLHLPRHNHHNFTANLRDQYVNPGDKIQAAVILYDKPHNYAELVWVIKNLEIPASTDVWISLVQPTFVPG